MNPIEMFATFFKAGGPFMYPIFAIAVLIIALTAERFWVIMVKSRASSRRLLETVLPLIRAGRRDEAAKACRSSETPLAQVAAGVLERPTRGANPLEMEAELFATADSAAAVALPPLSKRILYLAMLANGSTLLGLLGTVSGLIYSFSAVGHADPAQRSAFLAAGIAEALNCTAFGLIVAVPTLFIHAFFSSQVTSVTDDVEATTVKLIHAISGLDQPANVIPMGPAGNATVGASGGSAATAQANRRPEPPTADVAPNVG
jgi:biopolymer transport protein ExbB